MGGTVTFKRHYDDPPLEEAIFELFVQPSAPWSAEKSEALAKRLPMFSGKREELEDVSVVFQLGPGKSVAQSVNQASSRTRLWVPEQSRAIQFGAGMCTVNVRRPYGHFAEHLGTIQDVFAAYLDVTKPHQIGWVGQRYLNIARLPADSFPSDYFEMYPRLPPELPQAHRPFAVQVETAKFEQGTTIVNLALLEFAPDAAVYTIDIYARSDDTVPLEVDQLMAWQSRAHASIGSSFELTITDTARKLFKAVPCPP